MAKSMLAAIREAVVTPPEGLTAGSGSISPEAAYDRAYQASYKEGTKLAGDRWKAIMGAPGIAGNGERMAKVLDVGMQFPDMAAADVASFVVGHLVGTAVNAEAYEAMRLSTGGIYRAVAGLARPSAARGEASWKAFTEARNARFEAENSSSTAKFDRDTSPPSAGNGSVR
ncbi:hypothetical protein NKH10_30060 [Mesorhizobium sp. M1340]|uniref:hypothetical protein n=1 Tax=unclassified Mesorhizobium TaxID=325217 RepID=UPI00333AB7B9